jgi:hypothetical protein
MQLAGECSEFWSNGMSCTNSTAVSWLTGSTQNSVLAAPSQKNSPITP